MFLIKFQEYFEKMHLCSRAYSSPINLSVKFIIKSAIIIFLMAFSYFTVKALLKNDNAMSPDDAMSPDVALFSSLLL